MGLMSGIGRLLLVSINLVFLLLALALFGGGLFVRFGQKIYEPFFNQTLTLLEKTGKEISPGFSFNTDEIVNILLSLSVGMIVGGLFLAAFTIFGCLGGCYKIKCMLFLYAIIILVLLVAEFVVIGLLYGKKDIIKQPLKDGLKEYKGLTGTDLLSLGWNIVMIQFKCCGVDSYKDFDAGNDWKTITFTSPSLTPLSVEPLVTPHACCKNLPTTFADEEKCARNILIDETLSNGNIGCFKTIWDMSLGNIPMAVGILVACIVFQIILIAFACIIYKSDDKVNPV